MKNYFFVLLLMLFSATYGEESSTSDKKIDWNGSFRFSYFSDDKNFDSNNDLLKVSAMLKMSTREIEGYKFYFENYIDSNQEKKNDNLKYDLREGYLDKTFGSFDFRVGRQIIVWGKADKINPTDNLSVKNLKRLVTEDEEQRLGILSSKISYSFSDFKVSLINLFEWRNPIYPIVPNSSTSLTEKKPNDVKRQFGLKLERNVGSLDWGLSYFNGINKTPDLEFKKFDGQLLSLDLVYNKIQTYGLDFSTSLNDYVVRGEFAHTRTIDKSGKNSYVQNANDFTVLGIEKNLFDNFNLNAQVMHKYIENYQDPNALSSVLEREIAKTMNINTLQLKQNMFGISLRPSYKMLNESLEIETAVVFWGNPYNSIIKPKVIYSINDSSKVILGGEFFTGDLNTYFGRLKNSKNVFFEFRYEF